MTMLFDVVRRLFTGGPREAALARGECEAFPAAMAGAEAALARGRYDDAAAGFAEAKRFAGGNAVALATARNRGGVAEVSAGRPHAALAAFLRALDACPGFAPALVNVGNLLLEENALADATDHYEAALRADPHYAPAYRHLAIARKRAGDYAGSVRYLRRAAKLEATSAAVRSRSRTSARA